MIKQNFSLLFYSWVLLSITLTGCATLEKNYPERNYYILNVSNEVRNSSLFSGTVLEVLRFEISPGFGGGEFVYRKSELSDESDFYNQFFRPPSLLITEEVRKWLSQSGMFMSVIDSSYNVESNYILQGNINELYGDFRSSDIPKAVMGIQFFLVDNLSGEPKIVFQNNYRKEVVLSSNSPEDLAKGWNEALQQILTAFESDLRNADLKASK
jgi:cholesterol transport system auxiliary component